MQHVLENGTPKTDRTGTGTVSVFGYQMRFNESLSDQTAIKLMTDGILLAETHDNPLLKRYHTLIIDEAHERSLNIDFLLGYLKTILPKRPDLKIGLLRGNVGTRIAKITSGEFDATILAMAGLKRLGLLEKTPHHAIDPHIMPPAIAQGSLAITARANDERDRKSVV